MAETRWIGLRALRDEITHAPRRFTPWLAIYLERHGALIEAG